MALTPDQLEFVEDFFEELIYILSDGFVKKYKIGGIEQLHLLASEKDLPAIVRLRLELVLIRKDQK